MNWQEVCDEPLLRDLPYKIELNEWGKIVMRPLTNLRGILMGKALAILGRDPQGGLSLPSSPIDTAKGVKVADVIWASREFLTMHAGEDVFSTAPELCLEIMSPPGCDGEWLEKRMLYLDRGALEVWLCDERGNITFYDRAGPMASSHLFPEINDIATDDLPTSKLIGRGALHDH